MSVEVIVSIFTSAAVLGFMQFLIKRNDNRKDAKDDTKDEIRALRDDIERLRGDLERDKADDARRRILDASDSIRNYSLKHSKEWWDLVNKDIDKYNRYCREHAEYENNCAVITIACLEQIYAKALEDNDFL